MIALRNEKNISQEKVAEAIGVSRQSVAKWECGDSLPEIEKLSLLSRYFGVTVDSLVRDDEGCGQTPHDTKPSAHVDVILFLCRAKKETYAGQGHEVKPSRKNSHDLEYSEGQLSYYDSYIGGESFAGEEGVWQDNDPIWSMNYCGRVLDTGFSGDFLKEALSQVCEDNPFRGPLLFKNGEFTYHCRVDGAFDWFSGNEEIFFDFKKIYECAFHGGMIR